MFHFAKIVQLPCCLLRYLVVLRLPWSLVTVPLMLLSWIHFSDRPDDGFARRAGSQTVRTGTKHPMSRAAGTAVLDVIPVSADGDDPALVPPGTEDADPGSAGTQDANERTRRKLLGKWEDDYQGKRHLTVAEDGTGTMVVELDGIGKRLFADRMTFTLEWDSADGRVTMKTMGGEPQSKVQLVLKLYGSEAEYRILELTDDRMLLLDADGTTRYDWHRPATQPEN
jgi:hypothetical protein